MYNRKRLGIKKAGLIDITLRFYGEGSLRIRLYNDSIID